MNKPESVVIDGLEEFLDAEAASEADAAAHYLLAPDQYAGRTSERVGGIPGAEAALLIGPIVAPFLVKIVGYFADALAKKLSEKTASAAVDAVIEIVKSKTKDDGTALPTGEVATIDAVANALIKGGDTPERARRRAKALWEQGRTVGERMVGAACADLGNSSSRG